MRDGTSQSQRVSAALTLTSVKIDERSTPQLLNFLYRYAKYIFYYTAGKGGSGEPEIDRDWQDFFRKNAPFQYAAIHEFAAINLKDAYEASKKTVSRQPTASLWPVVNRVIAIALQLDTWYRQLDEQTDLHRILKTLIESDFSKALHRLVALTRTLPESDEDVIYSIEAFKRDPREPGEWGLTLEKQLAIDSQIAQFEAFPRRKKQKVLETLDELFNIFYKGVEQLQKAAVENFPAMLSGSSNHPPHLGLLYAFLQLFDVVKNNLNNTTRLHLDFFYKEVLQLKQREQVPDHAHIVVELAKQATQYLLKKETPLIAGKDKSGNDVTFLLENDVVFNKAVVSELRTLFKDPASTIFLSPKANSADGKGAPFQDPLDTFWPVLGSTEGELAQTGLMLSSPVLLLQEGKREVFVQFQLQLQSSPAALPNQQIKTNPPLSLLDVSYSSKKGWATLMDEKISELSLVKAVGKGENVYLLSLHITLTPSDPPVLDADPKVLKADYGVAGPLLRIIFNQKKQNETADAKNWYDLLSKATIKDVFINVSASNLKNVLLSNDNGVLDAAKTFQPFSAIPKVGSSVYIGSNEAFHKKLTCLTLEIEWDGLPKAGFAKYYEAYNERPNNDSFTVGVQKLHEGSWEGIKEDGGEGARSIALFANVSNADGPLSSDKTITLINLTGQSLTTLSSNTVGPFLSTADPLQPYTNASVNGFVRLTLEKDFLHDQYPVVLAARMIDLSKGDVAGVQKKLKTDTGGIVTSSANVKSAADAAVASLSVVTEKITDNLEQAKKDSSDVQKKAGGLNTDIVGLNDYVNKSATDPASLPNAPYTPAIKSFSISYNATASNADIRLLHLYPFEETNYTEEVPLTGKNFMPSFNDEGTLYIGLKEVIPGSNINLFFQLAEHTADPDSPTVKLQWSYLLGNEWKALEKYTQVIADTTQDLVASGIVTIALPWEINDVHTLLPSGFYWLKVAAPANTKAVCEAVLVVAQGARAVYAPQENDPERLKTPLAPNSISGLVVSDAAVKKITQGFPSFGGRMKEGDSFFYTRVSERMRHKGRAINIYDFEHMVLEAFPAIHKVKCIPQMKICRAEGKLTTLHAPGWVTIAVIPEWKDLPANSRVAPKASRILLQQIDDYLLQKASGFVKVQTINPFYQRMKFKGYVNFKPGKGDNFLQEQLKNDVQNHLSPWVFQDRQEIVFGGSLMMSSVLRFIESRDYVSYVSDFEMKGADGIAVKVMTAATPLSVLVPVSEPDVSFMEFLAVSERCKAKDQKTGNNH